MEEKIKELGMKIEEIEKRNRKVELDKKWETSKTRRACIAILTYIVVIIYSLTIQGTTSVLLSSFVPVMGFLLSTLSLKVIRKIWEKRNV